MLAIHLPEDVERRLERLAAATGLSVSAHAERAIDEYLSDVEDYHAAEREMEAVRDGRSLTVPLADLLKAYDVAN